MFLIGLVFLCLIYFVSLKAVLFIFHAPHFELLTIFLHIPFSYDFTSFIIDNNDGGKTDEGQRLLPS